MVLFYGIQDCRPKPSLIIIILSNDRRRLCAGGVLTSQLLNPTITSPHNHRYYPTFKIFDNPILFCQTKNAPRKSSDDSFISVRFWSSWLSIATFWTGTFANSSTRSGYGTAVYPTTIKTTSLLTLLKLIIFRQSKPRIFCGISTLWPLFLKLSSNIITSIFPCLQTLPSCLNLIWKKYTSLL